MELPNGTLGTGVFGFLRKPGPFFKRLAFQNGGRFVASLPCPHRMLSVLIFATLVDA